MRLVFNAVHHVLEHGERFFLVLDQRIFLAVAAKPDAFLQVVHRQQVVFPLVVDHVQHDDAFSLAEIVRPDHLLFLVVARQQLIVDDRLDLTALPPFDFVALHRHSELVQNGGAKARDVVLVRPRVFQTELVHEARDYAANNLQDAFFLVGAIQ